MIVSTNKEVTATPSEGKTLSAKDYVSEIFYGKGDSFEKYLALRTFDRNSHPAWLSATCFRIAESSFEEIPLSREISTMLYMGSIKYLANPVNSWILKNVHLKNPNTVRKMMFDFIKDINNIARPRFTETLYSQLGIPECGILSQLLNPDLKEVTKSQSEDGHKNLQDTLAAIKSKKLSIDDAFSSMIRFHPTSKGKFGEAAEKAYVEIALAITTYTVLSDILEHFDIPLNEKAMAELFTDLKDMDIDHWQTNQRVLTLFEFSKAIALNPNLVQNISRKEVFSRFAMRGRSLDDLEREVSKLAERHKDTQRHNIQYSVVADTTEVSKLDTMLESIEQLYREWDIDAHSEELAPLHLARLAVSQGVSFQKLERLLVLHEFNGSRVIEEIRPNSRNNAPEKYIDTSSSRSRHVEYGLEPEITRFTLLIHREGEKEPFDSWYNELPKSRRVRIDAALSKFSEGHLGNIRKLSTRARSEGDVSAYEVKIKDSGMRIYFRYLPNNRVIVLGGGDKDTQDRDIPTVMERAATYNGQNNLLSNSLREWGDRNTIGE